MRDYLLMGGMLAGSGLVGGRGYLLMGGMLAGSGLVGGRGYLLMGGMLAGSGLVGGRGYLLMEEESPFNLKYLDNFSRKTSINRPSSL